MTSLRIAKIIHGSVARITPQTSCNLVNLFKNNTYNFGCTSQYFSSVSDDNLKLNIDTSAVSRLKTILENNQFLRVFVEGGGCSGFQYKFELDTDIDPSEDMIFESDNVKLVADIESVKILNGATVEYHTDLMRAGFRVVDIPQAEKGCSCGVSFSVKL